MKKKTERTEDAEGSGEGEVGRYRQGDHRADCYPGEGLEGWRVEVALDDHLLRPGILFRADRGSPDCEGGGEAEDWRQQEPDSSLNIMGGKIIFIILSFNL